MNTFSNADPAFLIFILLQVLKAVFHLQVRIFLGRKWKQKFSSSIPGFVCNLETSTFFCSEKKKGEKSE